MNNKRNEFLLFFILITTIVFILFNQEIKSTISENKILYIYSSLPQTVGAVYGLTITGYIFFIGNQNSKIADDPTTEDIIKETNKEQFDSLKDLSALVFISILFCIFTIYSYNVSTPHFSEVNKVVVSLANSFSIGALIANFLFIVNVIDPKSIEKTADYPGGMNALRKEVAQLFYGGGVFSETGNIKTNVAFIVEKDGTISDVKAEGDNFTFNRQAEIALYSVSEKFSPAYTNGNPVRYRFRLPLVLNFD